MKRVAEIALERSNMATIASITSVFEGLASMRIAQIKDQVLQSQQFFNELWHIYNQLRVDSLFRFGREAQDEVIDKQLYIVVTAEGGFSGDIDQKLITWMLGQYDPQKHDIVIIGHHGAIQLTQAHIAYKKYFKLPTKDSSINVAPLIKIVRQYRSTAVFYQTYVSLMVQDIKKIDLRLAVQQAGGKAGQEKDEINESNYIFEPSNFAVIAHVERSMLQISLSQVILESKLAQYASRFRSMSVAKDKSAESERALSLQYNQARRSNADARLKEIINGLKRARA
jgi:F-type H+-transporting ATPase subunit gamma